MQIRPDVARFTPTGVRYIGASSGYAWQLAQALATSDRHGWARFVSMQNHYNLLYREEEREMNPLCLVEGIAIIPWSPLARGRLARGTARQETPRGGTDSFQEVLYGAPHDEPIIEAVQRVADARGTSAAEVGLAWLLAQPGVVAPIIGATKPAHLDSAIRAVDLTLSEEERRSLEAPYQPLPVKGIAGFSPQGVPKPK